MYHAALEQYFKSHESLKTLRAQSMSAIRLVLTVSWLNGSLITHAVTRSDNCCNCYWIKCNNWFRVVANPAMWSSAFPRALLHQAEAVFSLIVRGTALRNTTKIPSPNTNWIWRAQKNVSFPYMHKIAKYKCSYYALEIRVVSMDVYTFSASIYSLCIIIVSRLSTVSYLVVEQQDTVPRHRCRPVSPLDKQAYPQHARTCSRSIIKMN